MDESGKIHKVNVQGVKITYSVNEMIVCLTDDKAFDMQLGTMHIQNT